MQTCFLKRLRVRAERVDLEVPLHSTSLNAFVEIWFLGAYDNLYPGPSGVVLDAGANVGDFTLRASRWVGEGGTVIAVEPVPEYLSVLRRNISRNKASNVIVVDKAILDTRGTTIIGGKMKEAVSIDELLEELGIPRVDSVKLDIEGAEAAALRGGPHTICKALHFAVETHSKALEEIVQDRLSSEGFRVRRPSFFELATRMKSGLISNPAPFLIGELARLRSWPLTRGPFLWSVPRWFYQRRKPDWLSEQSELKLLTADR